MEIYNNLFIGNDNHCLHAEQVTAVIHACKTCHQKVLGYSKSLPQENPNYLIFKQDHHLYLNLVDMPREFMPKFTNPIMEEALSFIEDNIKEKLVLIHCNQGMSRSPSIGLIYLAKKGGINSASYQEAKQSFKEIYSNFTPGRGIELYMNNNWQYLMGIKW